MQHLSAGDERQADAAMMPLATADRVILPELSASVCLMVDFNRHACAELAHGEGANVLLPCALLRFH